MNDKLVTVKYKLGHTYEFNYIKTSYHCPNCSKQSVWTEDGAGDYYAGTTHFCTECNSKFYMPDGIRKAYDHEDLQILKQLTKKDE